MYEPATEPAGEARRRVLRHLRRPATHRALLPRVGEALGGFRLEERLGAGSYGTVFLARRDEGLFALKLLYLPRAGAWAWRELEVGLRLHHVGLVGVEAHGHHGDWPGFGPLFLYLVTRYVPGPPLDEWVERARPGAREAARVVLALAEQLARAHAVGVVHRDLKPDNVVVHASEGRAVLVDFGVGTYPGAPPVTGALLPGSFLSWAPEAWRFRRERRPGDRYEATPGDDLWSLGVVAWWLLVGDWPFVGETDEQVEDAVLHGARVAPHERNPRVPVALGAVCLRLLEKERAARYADAQAVIEALRAVLAGADAAWDVPLSEAWVAHEATTEREVSALPDEASRARSMPMSVEEPRAAPGRSAGWGSRALLCMAGLCAVLSGHDGASPLRREAVAGGSATLASWVAEMLADQEMAPLRCPLEGDGGAASPWGNPSASVAFATQPKDGTRVKTHRKNPASPTPPQGVTGRVPRAVCSLVLGALAAGCPAAQVRSNPQAEACPPGAVENMKEKLGLDIGAQGSALLAEQAGTITVREDELSGHTYISRPKMPSGTVLSGRFVFGKGRVYGRITRVHKPDGDTFSVCMEALGEPDYARGWEIYSMSSSGDSAEISTNFEYRLVDHLEQ